MAAIAKLVRHTPADDLKAYFASRSAEFLGPVEWGGPKNTILKQVLGVVDGLDDLTRNRLSLDADRIDRMTSEVGQTAIMSVVDIPMPTAIGASSIARCSAIRRPRSSA